MSPLFTGENEKQVKQSKAFDEHKVYPVVTADTLLSKVQITSTLDDIRCKVGGPDIFFQEYYLPLIDSFAEFVQILPSSNQGVLGGLLHEGIYRALFTLNAYREEHTKIDPLLDYVYFSVGLLYDVARVVEGRTVNITTRDGIFISKWLPYDASMFGLADYYRVRTGEGIPAWAGRKLTPIMARQRMTDVGFNWIAAKPQVLYIWISLLVDDARSAGRHNFILHRANELLERFKRTKEFIIPVEIEAEEAVATELADEFMDWLKEVIEKGNMSIDDINSDVLMTEEGLFVADSVIQVFVHEREAREHTSAEKSVEAVTKVEKVEKIEKLEEVEKKVNKQLDDLGMELEKNQRIEVKTVKEKVREKRNEPKKSYSDLAKVSALKKSFHGVKTGTATKQSFKQSVTLDKKQIKTDLFGDIKLQTIGQRGLTPGDIIAKTGTIFSDLDSMLRILGDRVPAIYKNMQASSAQPKRDYPVVTGNIRQVVDAGYHKG